MVNLSINLNKIALLRNQRDCSYPSVTAAAQAIVAAGAQGLTVHPRPDERHIRKSDVRELKALWQSQKIPPHIEYNIEGYPSPQWLKLVQDNMPTQATLVPDADSARTSDKGWDLKKNADFLKPIIAGLKEKGIRTSLFVEPQSEAVQWAKNIAADRIELFTGSYAHKFTTDPAAAVIPYATAMATAQNIAMGINAGHDLNLENLHYFTTHTSGLQEVSIGHAYTADALWLGLNEAVKSYLKALE